jgi:hypothetical protein
MLKIYNMKKVILFFLLISINVFSQDVKQIIAEETCECASKFDLDSLSSSDMELNFGLCMLESYNKHISEIPESERIDYKNNSQMEKFGEEIAIKMLEFCSSIILKLGESYNDSESLKETDNTVNGTYNGFLIDAFYTIFVKDSNGNKLELVILDYFDNVNLITDKLIENTQEIKVSFYEADLFYPKLNKFISTKIVTDIIKK